MFVKRFSWGSEKNEILRSERGISFEEVVLRIQSGGILDILEHPNPARYHGQRILVVEVRSYVYLVPFVETEEAIILKTIIPSRKATKAYIGRESRDG